MKKKILIVDDEPGIVRLLALRLQSKGYETVEAYDGIQCCLVAEEEIPVLFMTAYPTIEIKDLVLNMGAKGCISKPFICESFEQTIDMVINKYTLSDYQEIYPSYMPLH